MLQEGDVLALQDEFLPLALEDFLRPLVLGEDDESGGSLVQAVDDPDLGGGPVGGDAVGQVLFPPGACLDFHIGIQDGVQGGFLVAGLALGAAGGGYGQEAAGLVHDDVGVVLIHDPDTGFLDGVPGVGSVLPCHGNDLGQHQEPVSGEEGMVEGGPGLAVHEDLALGKHVLHTGLGLGGENLVQVFQEGTVVGDSELLSGRSVHSSSMIS